MGLRTIGRWVLGSVVFWSAIVGGTLPLRAQSGKTIQAVKPLKVYFVDVEGGQATLFVGPRGESLLIDTGWPDNAGRDAQRIADAAKRADVKKLDYVLITHYHQDHVGGLPQLLAKLPVGTFIDHGPNRETADAATEKGWEAYQEVLAAGGVKRIVAKPGEVLPLREIKVTVISADGQLIDHALPGGGEKNAYCAQSEQRPADQTENARSLGVEIEYDRVKLLDLGDLTWDKELALMCPVNRLGHMDALIVSHHGWNQSSSPALVDAISPEVAIMDNGEKKGGSPPTLDTVRKIPGLKQLWQLHYSAEGGAAHNVSPQYIANLQGDDKGNDLELTVSGSEMKVLNSRTGERKNYPVAR